MKNGKVLDLYSDYLVNAFGQTTATRLASLLNGEISRDQVQRSLADEEPISAHLWRTAKPQVRKIESVEGVMIVDDSIAEKNRTRMRMTSFVGTTITRNNALSRASTA